jgi:hypothetical protein
MAMKWFLAATIHTMRVGMLDASYGGRGPGHSHGCTNVSSPNNLFSSSSPRSSNSLFRRNDYSFVDLARLGSPLGD